jgi:hypothetical protein
MPSALDSNAVVANLISAILYNGKSGLIDQNLVNNQKYWRDMHLPICSKTMVYAGCKADLKMGRRSIRSKTFS